MHLELGLGTAGALEADLTGLWSAGVDIVRFWPMPRVRAVVFVFRFAALEAARRTGYVPSAAGVCTRVIARADPNLGSAEKMRVSRLVLGMSMIRH
jgi:hypothetical protein